MEKENQKFLAELYEDLPSDDEEEESDRDRDWDDGGLCRLQEGFGSTSNPEDKEKLGSKRWDVDSSIPTTTLMITRSTRNRKEKLGSLGEEGEIYPKTLTWMS